jgi:hypothetical protein
MAVAQITSGFQQFIKDLREHATKTYDAFTGEGRRTWFSKSKTRTTPSEMPRPEFDRDELNGLYEVATKDTTSGTVSDVIVLKKQIDFLAQAERASRIRYSSVHRSQVHAHARRYSHGKSALFSDAPGGIVDNLAQDLRVGTAANTTT